MLKQKNSFHCKRISKASSTPSVSSQSSSTNKKKKPLPTSTWSAFRFLEYAESGAENTDSEDICPRKRVSACMYENEGKITKTVKSRSKLKTKTSEESDDDIQIIEEVNLTRITDSSKVIGTKRKKNKAINVERNKCIDIPPSTSTPLHCGSCKKKKKIKDSSTIPPVSKSNPASKIQSRKRALEDDYEITDIKKSIKNLSYKIGGHHYEEITLVEENNLVSTEKDCEIIEHVTENKSSYEVFDEENTQMEEYNFQVIEGPTYFQVRESEIHDNDNNSKTNSFTDAYLRMQNAFELYNLEQTEEVEMEDVTEIIEEVASDNSFNDVLHDAARVLNSGPAINDDIASTLYTPPSNGINYSRLRTPEELDFQHLLLTADPIEHTNVSGKASDSSPNNIETNSSCDTKDSSLSEFVKRFVARISELVHIVSDKRNGSTEERLKNRTVKDFYERIIGGHVLTRRGDELGNIQTCNTNATSTVIHKKHTAEGETNNVNEKHKEKRDAQFKSATSPLTNAIKMLNLESKLNEEMIENSVYQTRKETNASMDIFNLGQTVNNDIRSTQSEFSNNGLLAKDITHQQLSMTADRLKILKESEIINIGSKRNIIKNSSSDISHTFNLNKHDANKFATNNSIQPIQCNSAGLTEGESELLENLRSGKKLNNEAINNLQEKNVAIIESDHVIVKYCLCQLCNAIINQPNDLLNLEQTEKAEIKDKAFEKNSEKNDSIECALNDLPQLFDLEAPIGEQEKAIQCVDNKNDTFGVASKSTNPFINTDFITETEVGKNAIQTVEVGTDITHNISEGSNEFLSYVRDERAENFMDTGEETNVMNQAVNDPVTYTPKSQNSGLTLERISSPEESVPSDEVIISKDISHRQHLIATDPKELGAKSYTPQMTGAKSYTPQMTSKTNAKETGSLDISGTFNLNNSNVDNPVIDSCEIQSCENLCDIMLSKLNNSDSNSQATKVLQNIKQELTRLNCIISGISIEDIENKDTLMLTEKIREGKRNVLQETEESSHDLLNYELMSCSENNDSAISTSSQSSPATMSGIDLRDIDMSMVEIPSEVELLFKK